MPRPIVVNPRGGTVRVAGQILRPDEATLKIDVWRHVRHPPPDLMHAFTVKSVDEEAAASYTAGHPAVLVGKVISWVWLCPQRDVLDWHVRVDVLQDGRSVPGYPAEYSGPVPPGQRLARLRVSERVQEAR